MSGLADLLDVTAGLCAEAEADSPSAEAHDLLHAVDRLLEAGVALQRHLAFHPEALVDGHGRCNQCGRLFAMPPRPRMASDKPRGCAFALGAIRAQVRWVSNYAMSVPFVGKALWLLRRPSKTEAQ